MSDGSLRERAIHGAKWVTVGRVVVEGSSFLAMLVVARLLTPAEVGHAAVAVVAFALASGLSAGSFGSPLIKADELDGASAGVAHLLSLLFGVASTLLCAGIGFALVPLIGRETGEMVALVSPSFLFASMAAVPQALRSRRLEFRVVMLIEMASAVVGALTSVALAVAGLGSAAMVLGLVATGAVIALLSPIGLRMPVARWHRREAGEILRFGLFASSSSVFFTAARNIDYALISGRLAAAQVGFYFRAFTLAVDYQGKISQIVLRLLFPVLSRAESEQSFRSARGRVVRLHSIVLFPLLGMLLVTAPDAIPLLYGGAWHGAIVPAQILVGAGVAQAIGTGIGPVTMAAGHPRALLVNNALVFVSFAIVVFVCSGFGLIATCIGVVVYRLVALVVTQYCLATRLLGIPLSDTLVSDPGPAFVAGAALVAAALPVFRWLEPLPAPLTLLGTAIVGFGVYVGVLRTVFQSAWADVATLAERVVPAWLRAGRRGVTVA